MLKFRLKNTKNGLLDSAMFYATNQQKFFLNVNLKNISYLSQAKSARDAYETIFICFTSNLYNYVKNSQGFKIDKMTFGRSILWLRNSQWSPTIHVRPDGLNIRVFTN